MKLTVGKKLGISYCAIIALMVISAAVVYMNVCVMQEHISEVMDKASPTVQACGRLLNGVNQSLADLRGYELTGADPNQGEYHKTERVKAWSNIDSALAELHQFSSEWSDSHDRELVQELDPQIAELRKIQQRVEDIYHTEDNVPAIKVFRNQLLPEAENVLNLLVAIGDLEPVQEATSDSRQLRNAFAHMQTSFAMSLAQLRGYINTGKAEFHDKASTHWEDFEENFKQVAHREGALTKQQQEVWAEIKQSTDRYSQLAGAVYNAREADNWNKAQYLVKTEGTPTARKVKSILNQLTQIVYRQKEALRQDMDVSVKAVMTTTIGATIVAALLAFTVAFVVTRRMVAIVQALSIRADAISKGDLRIDAVAFKSSDELGQLAEGFDTMLTNLKDLTSQVLSVTDSVNSAATQISSSASQQATSTKEQASTVQEITSTMREIGQTGAQIVDKARELSAAAEASAQASQSGITAAQDTSRTMEAIREQVEDVAQNIVALSEKTQAVGDIVATVNEVAEQSNLLALNATIEAASAGEQGSRFSVVANEMKNLADQAKQCTIQVRDILGDIQKGINSSVMLTEEAVKRVESGRQRVQLTEDTIRQMSRTTDDSVQAFEQIIGATNQQQIGFEQVTQGMEEIRVATQQTATGTSQLEQAVSSLSALSQQLKTAVGSYQV